MACGLTAAVVEAFAGEKPRVASLQVIGDRTGAAKTA
jgi:hypothetical protein